LSNDIKRELIIIELTEDIDINSFSCENEELNKFFHEQSKYNNQNLLSKIYICLNTRNKEIAGFISLSNYSLRLADSKDFGIQKVPAALIGRLAIDNRYRGYNLGNNLISFVYEVSNYIKNYIGCRLLVVEVKKNKDQILKYMQDYGFEILHESKGFFYLGLDLLT